MSALSDLEVLALLTRASRQRVRPWNIKDEQLSVPARRVRAEFPVGEGHWLERDYLALKDGPATVLLPTALPEALDLWRLYERRMRATHPSLRALVHTLAFEPGPHPVEPQMNACAVSAHRFACFFSCRAQQPSQFLFDHELAHLLGRSLRDARGLAKHTVLREWRAACRADQRDEVEALLWGDRDHCLKEVTIGAYHVSDYAAEQARSYNRHEEDFCDSLGLYRASRRRRGLQGLAAGRERRVRFEDAFPARAEALARLLS